jgi:hypothetical protein
MKFKFGGYTLDPEITNKKIKESKHTGNQLEILDISFQSDHEFEKPEFIYSEDTSEDKRWKVINNNSFSFDASSIKTYNWKIEELEELKITKLIIADLEFEPYLYKEEIEETNGDALIITAVTEITGEMWQKINDIPRGTFFSVIRQGISNEEKEMRFGRILWSEHEDKIKCRIVLVEKILDNYSNPLMGILEPQIPVLERQLLKNSKKIDHLLSLLLNKGIITNEEQEFIKIVNEEELDLTIFDEVVELDNFLEKSGQLEGLEKVT